MTTMQAPLQVSSRPGTDQRGQRPRRIAFWLLALVLTGTMLGTTLPTPLYVIYQSRWHFSAALVTVTFAVYAAAVIATLLLAGRSSDQAGRRPVLAAALGASALSTVVFILAPDLAALIAARIVSGLSAGLMTGTATATLTELVPASGRRRASLAATAANMAGLGLGPLAAGLFAQYAPHPTTLVFEVYLAVLAVAGLLLLLVPETVPHRTRPALRFAGLGIPERGRGEFIAAGVAAFAAFALLGLFSSLVPGFIAGQLHQGSHAVSRREVDGGDVVSACPLAAVSRQRGSSALVSVSVAPLACAACAASSASLSACLSANAGLKSPASMTRAFCNAYGAPSGFDCSRSTTWAGSRPSRRAKDKVSAVISARSASQLLSTSLALVPLPAGPSQNGVAPEHAEHRRQDVPGLAGAAGQDDKLPGPGRALAAGDRGVDEHRAAVVGDAGEPGGPLDADGAHLHPDDPGTGGQQAAGTGGGLFGGGSVGQHRDDDRGTPDRFRRAGRHDRAVGRQGSAWATVRFHTRTANPARARLAAIGAPIRPVPRKATTGVAARSSRPVLTGVPGCASG